MEELHYPLAAFAKKTLEEKIEQQKEIVRLQREAAKAYRGATPGVNPMSDPMVTGMPMTVGGENIL